MPVASWAVNPPAVAMFFFWAWFVVTGLTLALIDLRVRRLPNRLVALTLAVAIPLLLLHGVLNHSFSLFGSAFLGALTLVVAYGGLHLLGGVGMGDVKYAAVVGLYLGSLSWSALWWGTLMAFLLATGASVWSVSICHRQRGRSMPFGPAMVAGTMGGALISLGGG
jgi:leader peptidase (prepilin peptidase) / N-methyltransferase